MHKKGPTRGPFLCIWLGDQDYSAFGLTLRAAALRATFGAAARRSSNLPGSNPGAFQTDMHKKGPTRGPFLCIWLGDQDSNLG